MEVVEIPGAIRRVCKTPGQFITTNTQCLTGRMPFLSPTNSVKSRNGSSEL